MTDEELEAMHTRKRERLLARKTKKIRTIQFRRTFWILSACFVVLLDQLSKWAIVEHVIRPAREGRSGYSFIDWYQHTPSMSPYTEIHLTSFFNIVMAWNTGVSFSLFQDTGIYTPYILIFVALGITLLFGFWLWSAEKHFHGLCNALIIGGALGNVIDRARFGAVIDFLDFHVKGYHWPAFNVADMSVVSGISLLMIVSLFFETKTRQRYRKNNKKRRDFQKFLRERFGI